MASLKNKWPLKITTTQTYYLEAQSSGSVLKRVETVLNRK